MMLSQTALLKPSGVWAHHADADTSHTNSGFTSQTFFAYTHKLKIHFIFIFNYWTNCSFCDGLAWLMQKFECQQQNSKSDNRTRISVFILSMKFNLFLFAFLEFTEAFLVLYSIFKSYNCIYSHTWCVITCPYEEFICSRCVLCWSVWTGDSWKGSRKPNISMATISIVCWLFEHHASPELSLLSVWKLALLWASLHCFNCLENAE